MNITDFKGDPAKPLGVSTFFNAEKGEAKILRLDDRGIIKEHKSHLPARLILLRGAVVYEETSGSTTELARPLDYIEILPEVLHKVTARADSYLLLLR